MNKYLLLTLVAGGVTIIDQLSKYAVQHMLTLHDPMEVIAGFFNITYIFNPGAAFGLFGNISETARMIILVGISLIAFAILFYIYIKIRERDNLILVPIALIIGGALGNLIDRIRFQMVVDFLDFYWGHFHWPAFNIADAAITVGTLILVITILFTKKRHILNV
ncbi:MAG: signal peptidase II [Nitrospirae bacterium]|nr:signal peptidase II [Nitrospirota bacterium]